MGSLTGLDGSVALVTGAARNIGAATVRALSEAGAAVAIHANRSIDEAESLARALKDAGRAAMAVQADITRPDAVEAMMETVRGTFGRLDILINNAALRGDAPLSEISWQDWRQVTGAILDGTFLCCQAAMPLLRAGGRGAIVNITGLAAYTGIPGRAHVSAAKAAVAGLSRSLAAELAAEGVTVNCVSPGYIATTRAGGIPAHFRARPVPLGRPGTPEEVASMVCYLVGPSARYVTGQTFHINGGWFVA